MNNDAFEENVNVGEANADSRKRPLESEISSDDMDNASSKRSNFGAGKAEPFDAFNVIPY